MPGVGKDKDTDLGFSRMDSEQIKGARLSSIVALGKRAGLQYLPINLNKKDGASGSDPKS